MLNSRDWSLQTFPELDQDLSFQIGIAQSVERMPGLTLYAAEG